MGLRNLMPGRGLQFGFIVAVHSESTDSPDDSARYSPSNHPRLSPHPLFGPSFSSGSGTGRANGHPRRRATVGARSGFQDCCPDRLSDRLDANRHLLQTVPRRRVTFTRNASRWQHVKPRCKTSGLLLSQFRRVARDTRVATARMRQERCRCRWGCPNFWIGRSPIFFFRQNTLPSFPSHMKYGGKAGREAECTCQVCLGSQSVID
jgi:hypothetical protein